MVYYLYELNSEQKTSKKWWAKKILSKFKDYKGKNLVSKNEKTATISPNAKSNGVSSANHCFRKTYSGRQRIFADNKAFYA